MKKIYIAGKITGEPIYDCVRKFEDAGVELMFDYDLVIPLFLDGIHFGIEHHKAIEICLEALKECDVIYMMKDWKESKGAKMEHDFAIENGIEIIYE